MTLTPRQRQIVDYIKSYQAKEGTSPSLREICQALGLASSGSLVKHLRVLEAEGLLINRPGLNRSWRPAARSVAPSIPLIGQIAAGLPILAQENWEEQLQIDPALFGCDESFALRVKGDSMIGAQIMDGDLAVIRPQEEADQSQIVAVLVEGLDPEATLKIFRRSKDAIELHPANPLYQPLVFKGEERGQVRILGRLAGIIRPMR